MKLSLAPISYFWSADTIRAFYEQAKDWPVDIVYLGEIICGKRRSLTFEDWMAIAQGLSEAGKEVVLSTMALLEAESELVSLARICDNGSFLVEANDMGAVWLLTGSASESTAGLVPFVIGPHINAYNTHTLSLLAETGATRWVMPAELSRSDLSDLQREKPNAIETEIFVYGRLPLAFSARCFTARAHNLPKDQCDFRCGEYPDGLLLETQEDQDLFTINGIQMQSARLCNLLMAVGELTELNVDVLRIAPQIQGTEAVVHAFRDILDGNTTATAALATLPPPGPGGWCNGYWYGNAGIVWE